jgi:hypothetical protein
MPHHRPFAVITPVPAADHVERREHPRYSFTAGVEAVDNKSRSVLQARTSDLSRGGCYVDVFCPFPLKASVKLRLTKEEKSFVADANVVCSRVGMGMGLQFTRVEPAEIPLLEKWIAELSGSSAPLAAPPPTSAAATPPPQSVADPKLDALLKREQWCVLNEFILTLMRRSIVTPVEGKAMLEKLLRQYPQP